MPDTVRVKRHKRALKTNSRGYIIGLEQVAETRDRESRRAIPEITIHRLNDSSIGTPDEIRERIMLLFGEADSAEVNIPTTEEMNNPRGARFYMARANGQDIGTGAVARGNSEIKHFFIRPQFRRQNYGVALAQKLEEVMKDELDITTSKVFVKRSNTTAFSFWKNKMGYTESGGGENNTIRLIKSLNAEIEETGDRRARRDIQKI